MVPLKASQTVQNAQDALGSVTDIPSTYLLNLLSIDPKVELQIIKNCYLKKKVKIYRRKIKVGSYN